MKFLRGLLGAPRLQDNRSEEEKQRQAARWGIGDAGGASWDALSGMDSDPAPKSGGGKIDWNDIGSKLSDFGDSLGAAQAYWSGDAGTGARISDMQMSRVSAARKAAADAQAAKQKREQLIQAGVNPLLTEDETAVRQALTPKTQEPTAMERNWRMYDALPDEEKRKFEAYQRAISPWNFRGEDGLPYEGQPPGALPTFDEDAWNKAGGGTGNGVGNFRYRR